MSYCCVFGCRSYRKYKLCRKAGVENVTFHSLPKKQDILNVYKKLCKQTTLKKHALICSLHFKEDDFVRNLKYELLKEPLPNHLKRLKPDAIPSLHLPDSLKKISGSIINRRERKEKRDQQKMLKELLRNQSNHSSQEADSDREVEDNVVLESTNEDTDEEIEIATIAPEHERDIKVNTEMDERDVLIKKLIEENAQLKHALKTSKDVINKIFTEGQQRKLMQTKNIRVNWKLEDISQSNKCKGALILKRLK